MTKREHLGSGHNGHGPTAQHYCVTHRKVHYNNAIAARALSFSDWTTFGEAVCERRYAYGNVHVATAPDRPNSICNFYAFIPIEIGMKQTKSIAARIGFAVCFAVFVKSKNHVNIIGRNGFSEIYNTNDCLTGNSLAEINE